MTLLRCLFIASVLALSACAKEVVQHDLSERQAVQIQVLLENADIEAVKVRDPKARTPSFFIEVPSSEAAKARRLLVSRDLPRRESRGMSEVFSADPGLIPTAMQERARLIAALSGEVEKKLRMVPGVADAHVTVVLPDDDPLRDADAPTEVASASVVYRFLVKAEAEEKPPLSEEDCKNLVAASVPGLATKNVVVIARPSRADVFEEMQGDPTVSFLGVRVHPGSRGRFRAVVFGLMGVALICLIGLGTVVLRQRRAVV